MKEKFTLLKKTRKIPEISGRRNIVLSNYPGSNGGITLCKDAASIVMGKSTKCKIAIMYNESKVVILNVKSGQFTCSMNNKRTSARIYCNLEEVFATIGTESMRIVKEFEPGEHPNSIVVDLK